MPEGSKPNETNNLKLNDKYMLRDIEAFPQVLCNTVCASSLCPRLIIATVKCLGVALPVHTGKSITFASFECLSLYTAILYTIN